MNLKMFSAVLLCLLYRASGYAESRDDVKDIMQSEYNRPGVAASFNTGREWFPYPEYKDREGWNEILGPYAGSLIRSAESRLDYEWKHIPATAYLAFEREGDRTAMEKIEGANRGALIAFMMGELAEGKGRFIDQIANGLYQSTERHNWSLSAHNPAQSTKRSLPSEPLIDLASGRYGAVVSVACRLFKEEIDKIDPMICELVRRAVKRNILDSFLEYRDGGSNWWMGNLESDSLIALNNWTPWCCADVMTCAFLMEKDPERLSKEVEISVRVMDNFLNYIKSDGACEEGPGYWGAAGGKTYDYAQLMYDASGGAFDVFDNKRLLDFGEYMSRQFIGDGWCTNFADGGARSSLYTMGVWEYGNGFNSREMKNLAICTLADRKTGRFRYPSLTLNDGYRAIQTALHSVPFRREIDSVNRMLDSMRMDDVLADLRRDVPLSSWYPETEMCFLRNTHQWFLGAKGGYNDESHNHNDIGTFVLFIRRVPVFVDAGVGTYTRATFSPAERYTLWSMRGDWHNIPAPNSCIEMYGRQYRSRDARCDIRKGVFSLNLSDAYPSDAALETYLRSYRLSPGGESLEITDEYCLKARKQSDIQHFLVKGQVTLDAPGILHIECDGGLRVRMTYPGCFTASVEEKILEDPVMKSNWGDSLRRITLTGRPDQPSKGKYTFTITEEK